MKKIFLALAIIFSINFNNIYAQKKNIEEIIECSPSPDKHVNYKGGGLDKFISDIKTSIITPTECYDYEIEGDVSISFIVTKKGKLKNIKVTNTPFNALANSVLKLVNKSSGWEPAEKDGKKVNYQVNLKVPFSFVKNSDAPDARFNGANIKGFEKYLQKKVKIPQEAMVARVEGVVKLTFTVNKDGSLSNFKTISSQSDILTNYTIAEILKDGKWTPARRNNEAINQDVTVSVIYKLPQKLDQEPMYRNYDFVYILDHDPLIDMIKLATLRGGDMEFDWYIYKDGRCELRNQFSYSLRAFYLLQNKFEHLNWRAGKYGGQDVSVKYRITIRGNFLQYDTFILMDEEKN